MEIHKSNYFFELFTKTKKKWLENSKKSLHTKYLPKSICIISSWPFFSIFSKVLGFLYLNTHNQSFNPLPLPYYIKYLTKDILVPSSLEIKIEFQLGNDIISFMRAPLNLTKDQEKYFSYNDVNILFYIMLFLFYFYFYFYFYFLFLLFIFIFIYFYFLHFFYLFQFPLSHLFNCLDLNSILLVLSGLLRENKVLLLSSKTVMLTVISQILLSLMYPFTWPHVYIPTLPIELFFFSIFFKM